MIDSGAKLKCDERQHWFLELIGQFKSALQHSSTTHKVLAKFRNFALLLQWFYSFFVAKNKSCISGVIELFDVAVSGICCLV